MLCLFSFILFVDPSKRGQFFHVGVCLCSTKKRNLQFQLSCDQSLSESNNSGRLIKYDSKMFNLNYLE